MKNSIYHTYLLSVVGAALLMAAGIGSYWVVTERRSFDSEAELLREAYISEQRARIKDVVGQIIQYVTFRRETAEQEIRNSLRERVDDAVNVCRSIYDRNRGSKSDAEVLALIRETLRPMRFNDGRGYYFIYDMTGTNILLPGRVDLEGRNLLDLQDSEGGYTVRRYIEILGKQDAGFMTWTWYRPGRQDRMSKKIGYARVFEPLDIFIGTGEYVEDAVHEIQQEILAYINTFRFDNDNYVFVYDFNAITLAHYKPENIGVNQWNFVDPHGVHVLQELIKLAKQPEGGFLRYVGTIKPETGEPSEKISYAGSVSDWNWMVGAGVYVDDIERVLAGKQTALQQKIRRDLLQIGAILLLALLVITLLARVVSSRLKRNVSTFSSFFQAAAHKSVEMDERDIHYAEFKHLVEPANFMIEERRKAEDELEKSKEWLDLTISATGQGLWDWNIPSDRLTWDHRAFTIFGCEKGSVLPSMSFISSIIRDEDLPAAREAMADHLAGSTPDYRAEYRLGGDSGKTVWILDQGRVTERDETGKPLRAVGTYRDISELKQAEREQNDLREQLNRSRKMEALGLLAGGVAHDLNNVLSGIVGYPDLLLDDLPPAHPMRGPLTTIRDSGQKAADIVQDMLALARRGVVNYQVVNINDIVTEYLDSPDYRRLVSQFPGMSVRTALDPGLRNIKGSGIHLRKSLTNLVSNGFEAQPGGGEIVISSANRTLSGTRTGYEDIPPGDYVVLAVRDAGTGIAPGDIGQIFEPFYTKKEMGHRSGTGLGMAIVWGVLRDHKGYIDIFSRIGEGTCFELYYPATDELPEETDTDPEEPVGPGAAEQILVIDDLPEQRTLAVRALEHFGYRACSVESGEAAVAYVRDHRVDLIVLDMIMEPGIDGLETYRRISAYRPGQKAVITSGYSETDRVREAQRLGAGRYLRKPYTLKELGRAVRRELDEGLRKS